MKLQVYSIECENTIKKQMEMIKNISVYDQSKEKLKEVPTSHSDEL